MHPGIQSWVNLVIYAFNAFSVPLLSKTLLAPWENDRAEGSTYDFIDKFVFGIFSRVLGLVARIIFIFIGLVFTLVVILTFPIFFLIPIKINREFLENLDSFGAFLSYGNTYSLNKHSHDLYSSSSLKLYGKDKALRMIERGLSKDKVRNVLLVGETGVGKSIIVAHLGRLGKSGLSFPGIHNHRVVELAVEGIDLNDFDKSMNDAAKAGNVIVVIENIHEYESIYERLTPYLSMSHLGIIATTDFSNYDQVLKVHPQFLSMFEKVNVDPTNPDDTLSVLKNIIQLEGISIKEDAIVEIVNLSNRYIGNQPQPLKSILVLEELRALKRKTLSIDDVRQIISDKTNIPIGALGIDERKVLVGLEDRMKSKIIGQEEAVKDVSEALRRLRTGIADPSKPAGSFLFLGPTGVGKTYTAKILAESYFGHKNAMIRFDMSEFSLSDSVTTFSDRLASVIEENPLSLVFLDELEKSNRAIHHLLLQVLDEGRLTRESGREANFKNSIIIATSNAGSADIMANPGIDKKIFIDKLISDGKFAPEFLNRFSAVILFKPLDKDNIKKVTALMLQEVADRLLAEKQIKLVITDALIDKIASAGFDPEFGARPINRAIEEIVENKVADYIVAGNPAGEIKIL
jgi:ATP-dependent Clp protease ATP-binding subunit ClpA